jgi:S1-C subfamily serine protease
MKTGKVVFASAVMCAALAVLAGCTSIQFMGTVTPHTATDVLENNVRVFTDLTYEGAVRQAGEAGFEVILEYEGRVQDFGIIKLYRIAVLAKDADGIRSGSRTASAQNNSAVAGWLGVNVIDPQSGTKDALGVSGKRGALAHMVFLGSPADKAGLAPGDFITAVNGQEAADRAALSQMVASLKAGVDAVFTVIRDGKQTDFSVRIETRTVESGADNSRLWPGVQVEAAAAGVAGVSVVMVVDKSPAAVLALQPGDVLTSVNGEAVRDLASFYRLLREKASQELWFGVRRDGKSIETQRFGR